MNKTGRLAETIKNIAVAQKEIDESKKKHPEWQAPTLRLVHIKMVSSNGTERIPTYRRSMGGDYRFL